MWFLWSIIFTKEPFEEAPNDPYRRTAIPLWSLWTWILPKGQTQYVPQRYSDSVFRYFELWLILNNKLFTLNETDRHRRIHLNPGSGSGTNVGGGGGKKSAKNAGSAATAASNSNSNANNNNNDFANSNNTLATITGQQLTVAASATTPQGQTIQLVPLNVGHFQGTNLAAATQQWIIGQQRLANSNNPSNNSNATTANGNSSNSTTPTTSSWESSNRSWF